MDAMLISKAAALIACALMLATIVGVNLAEARRRRALTAEARKAEDAETQDWLTYW